MTKTKRYKACPVYIEMELSNTLVVYTTLNILSKFVKTPKFSAESYMPSGNFHLKKKYLYLSSCRVGYQLECYRTNYHNVRLQAAKNVLRVKGFTKEMVSAFCFRQF